jgi:hypothetical protein
MAGRPKKTGQWSAPDTSMLKRMYGMCKRTKIAQKVGRPLASVNKMVAKLFPESTENNNKPWTASEVAKLKNMLGSEGDEVQWARIFKRSVADVERKIIGFQSDVAERPWTRESLADLKRLFGSRSNFDLTLILGMPEKQIVAKAQELRLAKDKKFCSSTNDSERTTKMPRWSSEDIETLKRLHPITPNTELAQRLNRTTKSITSKAASLGLKKQPEHLRKMGRDNVDWRYNRNQCEEEENGKSSDSNA